MFMNLDAQLSTRFSLHATFTWISLVISVPLIGFMIYLVVYHAHITYLGISTFEKILFERMRLKNDLKLKVSDYHHWWSH